ncbi:MAG: 2-oxoglutarate dehydrogenase E1 component [Chloroflexi bacterium]|nr:2-oxoglutarate dehydrogenase E1 component [Chloroflexota bacterium]
MKAWEAFYGPNVGYVLELYERYQQDPTSVDAATRAFFEHLASNGDGYGAIATLARPATESPLGPAADGADGKIAVAAPAAANGAGAPAAAPAAGATLTDETVNTVVHAARLARSIREYGHLAARLDPLGRPGPGDPMIDPATHNLTDEVLASLPGTIVFPSEGDQAGSCLDAIRRLFDIYSGPIGYEFDHVQDYDERMWLYDAVESGRYRAPSPPEERRALLERLTEVEGFERFLHRVFVGQKRFSIEGNDCLVPMLDELVHAAAEAGTRDILLGMAHRGRLNVLAHVLHKPYEAILAEFPGGGPDVQVRATHSARISSGWTGDVKYHLGAQRTVCEDGSIEVRITMADNPSHLEFVNPVVEGFARAAQDRRDRPGPPRQEVDTALAVTVHGDAAFPGEGVVAETLNLSRLPGYQTAGTVRLIANNQIGFTTDWRVARSTLYAGDLAKGFEIPIIHVNADDPEACLAVIRLAHAYRQRFHRDVLVDLVGYRRWGHNEGDEPGFTQPRLYATIASHPTVRALYAERLVSEGVLSAEEVEAMQRRVQKRLERARETAQRSAPREPEPPPPAPPMPDTAVPADRLRELNEALLSFPVDFSLNPKLRRPLDRRREALDKPGGIDWALAEALAFASILADGTPIRLSGQDTERGTFSQRHLVFHDVKTDGIYVPLQALPQARASFAVYNSPLTEAAIIGFEYGYSVHAPEALVLWEAQFGDFANVGQVLIDQFIAASWAKWRQQPALTLLLPHGYEGQGPEHSSARLERFLQLAAEDNLRIASCTTAAQYFHLLRLQAAMLEADRRPLVVMTPKSLLRHPLAGSSLQDLAEGRFQPVIDDRNAASRRDSVTRLILCSGKVAVDLTTTVRARPDPVDWVAVARVEQLYPFPADGLARVLGTYPHLQEVVWLQEEPRNMGAWRYMQEHLPGVLPEGVSFSYIGRPERAATAEGSPEAHAAEQGRIVEAAFGGQRPFKIETHGVGDVS